MKHRLIRAVKEWLVQSPFIAAFFFSIFFIFNLSWASLYKLFNEFLSFAMGNGDKLVVEGFSWHVLPILVVFALINLLLMGVALDLMKIFYKPAQPSREMQNLVRESLFELMFVTLPPFAFFEELIFRALLIGVPSYLFSWNQYFLILVSSALFALLHLFNFKSRRFLTILIHFYMGIVLAYIYLKYGLWMAIMIHYLYDVMAMVIGKLGQWLMGESGLS